MTQGQKTGFATSLGRIIGRPMAPTPIEIRSRLSPVDFERALQGVPAIIERGDSPYLHARRLRMVTIKTSGQAIDIRFRSVPKYDTRKGYQGGTLFIDAHLTGRIGAVQDGAVLSLDLVTFPGAARGLVRLTPSVTALGAVATVTALVLAPTLILIPAVVAFGGACFFVTGRLLLRWSQGQKADEIGRLLLVMNEATASITTDVPEERRSGSLRDAWLRDVPGSMIAEQMHQIEQDASGRQ